jgi:hypothetical protein
MSKEVVFDITRDLIFVESGHSLADLRVLSMGRVKMRWYRRS